MNRPTILVVEDHEAVRDAARAALAEAFPKARVIEAKDGSEAVAQTERFRPGIVVMDRHMPCMDGVEATRRIKRAFPETKVIFFSLSDHARDRRAAREAGADGYVGKGDGPEKLVQTVQKLLDGIRCDERDGFSSLAIDAITTASRAKRRTVKEN